jgi:hypothetical protein
VTRHSLRQTCKLAAAEDPRPLLLVNLERHRQALEQLPALLRAKFLHGWWTSLMDYAPPPRHVYCTANESDRMLIAPIIDDIASQQEANPGANAILVVWGEFRTPRAVYIEAWDIDVVRHGFFQAVPDTYRFCSPTYLEDISYGKAARIQRLTRYISLPRRQQSNQLYWLTLLDEGETSSSMYDCQEQAWELSFVLTKDILNAIANAEERPDFEVYKGY